MNDDDKTYDVFVRAWAKRCDQYAAKHEPGRLSRKAEFEEH